jgi:hypothetical protein
MYIHCKMPVISSCASKKPASPSETKKVGSPGASLLTRALELYFAMVEYDIQKKIPSYIAPSVEEFSYSSSKLNRHFEKVSGESLRRSKTVRNLKHRVPKSLSSHKIFEPHVFGISENMKQFVSHIMSFEFTTFPSLFFAYNAIVMQALVSYAYVGASLMGSVDEISTETIHGTFEIYFKTYTSIQLHWNSILMYYKSFADILFLPKLSTTAASIEMKGGLPDGLYQFVKDAFFASNAYHDMVIRPVEYVLESVGIQKTTIAVQKCEEVEPTKEGEECKQPEEADIPSF